MKKDSIRRNEDEHIVELPTTDRNDGLDVFLLKHKSYTLNHLEKSLFVWLFSFLFRLLFPATELK
ncbi:MAG: hypothetical protein IJ411_02585 [Oscillospiraceae bacterium]|nr:hypothetical protein [Oscillospiraceae bacterium]